MTPDYANLNKALRKHRSALTRAKNRREPLLVVKAVQAAVADFNRLGWPDQWPTFRTALEDAADTLRFTENNPRAAAHVEQLAWELFA